MRKRWIVAALLLGVACATKSPLSGRYAVILDRSVGTYGSSLQRAFSARLPFMQFVQSVGAKARYDAVIVVRGIGCLSRLTSAGCGPVPPSAFSFEIYRDGKLVDQGRARAASGYDGAATSPQEADALAEDVVRALSSR